MTPKPESYIQETLDKIHRELVVTLATKNHDYAGPDVEFKNFIESAQDVGVSTTQGILLRFRDKVSRILNLSKRPPAVVSESLRDSIVDAIGYLVILAAYLESEADEVSIAPE